MMAGKTTIDQIKVYHSSGKNVKFTRIDEHIISLGHSNPPGLYIIYIDNEAFKIIKR